MDRRESLKTLLVSSLAAGAVVTGCSPDTKESPALGTGMTTEEVPGGGYGRTDEEQIRDQLIQAKPSIFNEHEMETLGILADIILPADDISGAATEAGVVEFIDYIVKEMVNYQIPIRSGVAWIDRESHDRFEKSFKDLTDEQQIAIVEGIAYPLEAEGKYVTGANLFTELRNLVLTGFYTSEMGIKDLGYQGNVTNFWDGIPEEVLAEHGLSYDPDIQYITQDQRNTVAQWDDEGNLIPGKEA